MKKRIHIHVAVPTTSNTVGLAIHQFLMQLTRVQYEEKSPYVFSFFCVNGIRPVEYARNVLVGHFLKETDADAIWFLDDDMLPTNETVMLLPLLADGADICAGRMHKFDHANELKGKSTGVALCAFDKLNNGTGKYRPLTPMPGESLIQECDAVGTASMLIRREVLEDKRLWLPSKFTGIDGKDYDVRTHNLNAKFAPPIFRTLYAPNGCPLMGEDIDFCERAKDLGYTIKVHLGATIGHYKPVDLDQVVQLCADAIGRVRALEETSSEEKELAALAAQLHERAA